MKTLIILRHAKSSRDDPTLADHDRPLTRGGERNALRVGKFLHGKNIVPDLIVSSTALRARSTAVKVARGCGYRKEILLRKTLYTSGPGGYIKILQRIPDNYQCVMLVEIGR